MRCNTMAEGLSVASGSSCLWHRVTELPISRPGRPSLASHLRTESASIDHPVAVAGRAFAVCFTTKTGMCADLIEALCCRTRISWMSRTEATQPQFIWSAFADSAEEAI